MFSRDPYYEPLVWFMIAFIKNQPFPSRYAAVYMHISVWFMIAFIKNQPFPSRYAAVYMHISYILNSYFLQTLHAFR